VRFKVERGEGRGSIVGVVQEVGEVGEGTVLTKKKVIIVC
jgi:hypothetical protein